MMKVPQHPYCSAQAMHLRRQDGTPPWGVHVSEVDSLAPVPPGDPLREAWVQAAQLRAEIEAREDGG